jgi:hypothetical protein
MLVQELMVVIEVVVFLELVVAEVCGHMAVVQGQAWVEDTVMAEEGDKYIDVHIRMCIKDKNVKF